MNDLRTAAQQALEALEVYATHRGLPGPCPVRDVEYALRAALAQQDEPVAAVGTQSDVWRGYNGQWQAPGEPIKMVHLLRDLPMGALLYLAPPQSKPLAEEVAALTAQRDDLLQAVKKIRSFTVDGAMVYAALIDINSVASRAIKAVEAKE
jgi:hypothetical protein